MSSKLLTFSWLAGPYSGEVYARDKHEATLFAEDVLAKNISTDLDWDWGARDNSVIYWLWGHDGYNYTLTTKEKDVNFVTEICEIDMFERLTSMLTLKQESK